MPHRGARSVSVERSETIGRVVELVIIDGRPAVRGECDLATAQSIENWLAGFDGHPLEVDLRDVTFFDAAALRALLAAHRHNPHIRIVSPHVVRRVLEITATSEIFDGRDRDS
jgi:anti-anti-sigma factor